MVCINNKDQPRNHLMSEVLLLLFVIVYEHGGQFVQTARSHFL